MYYVFLSSGRTFTRKRRDAQDIRGQTRNAKADGAEHTQVCEHRTAEQRRSMSVNRQAYGELAQLGERLLCTQEAKSSNLLFSTTSEEAQMKNLEN